MGSHEIKEEPRNWKEFENLVSTLEAEGAKGNLDNVATFSFIDSSTVEAVLYKGAPGGKRLDALLLRFKLLKIKFWTNMVVSHCVGKIMIDQGTDSFSHRHLLDTSVVSASDFLCAYTSKFRSNQGITTTKAMTTVLAGGTHGSVDSNRLVHEGT